MSSFISYLISGISLGSVYAIIALGYTMVYGIAKMLNFAHGDVIMVGSYVVYVAVSGMGLNPILAILLSIIICTLMLQNVALLIWGADTKSFSNVISLPSLKLAGGSIVITGVTIVTIIGGILIMAGLMLFISKTKTGQAMLAVSEDKGAAQLMGINVNKTISITFAIGSGLAAIAGVLLCSAYPSLTPYTGAMPGIKAFVAAVFGGIGSIPGAFIGGVVLGILEIFGKAYISSQMADAIVFGVLIVVLVVKPTGILGKNIQEKV